MTLPTYCQQKKIESNRKTRDTVPLSSKEILQHPVPVPAFNILQISNDFLRLQAPQ
jgi:hypothetical protein